MTDKEIEKMERQYDDFHVVGPWADTAGAAGVWLLVFSACFLIAWLVL